MSGAAPPWLRWGLWPFSLVYGSAVRLRNALFETGLRSVERLPVTVISVGNVTVGGTGKTPTVMWLVEKAREQGREVGVLARGYGREPGAELNEEGAMLALRFPGLPQVQDPDRVRGGRRLVEQGVDLIVVDDGFQHRRLHRDVNLLCIDARSRLGDHMLLPAGRLREPISGLRRADVVLLTRAERLSPHDVEERSRQIRAIAGRGLPVFATEHAPRDVVAKPSGEVLVLSALRGRRVALLSAIARPRYFEHTVAALGAEVCWHAQRRDHHRFSASELEQIASRARDDDARLVVTEKDAPKLAEAGGEHWVLRVDLRFLGQEPGLELLGDVVTNRVTWRHRVVYAFARVGLFLVNALPERVAYGIAGGAGRLFFRCSKRRQRCAMKILRNAYPEGKTDKELLRLASLGTANLFKVAVDMVRLIPWVNSGRLAERYDFAEMNNFPEPPFVGVTAHVGSWEVGAIACALLRGEAHLIAREFKNPLLQQLILRSRQRAGVIVHPKRGGMRPVVRGLAEGHFAMQAGDQRQRQRGVMVPFFGELASTDRSAAVLALRKGYPISIAGAERIGPGFRFRGMLVETIQVTPTGDHEADVKRVTAEVNRGLERLILRRPEQYLWIHDRYRKSREERDEQAAS